MKGSPCVDLDEREIGLAADSDELGFVRALPVSEIGVAHGQLDRGRCEDHANALRARDDVMVGDDVSVGIDYHPGADCALAFDYLIVVAVLTRAIAIHLDLDNREHGALCDFVEGLIVGAEDGGGIRRCLLGLGEGW